MRRYTAVEKYSFVFQIKMLFIRKCMSPNKNAIQSCPCEHAVEGISDNLGIKVVACCYNCLKKLSQIIWLLIMWHIPNLMLQVAPKKKIAHRQVRRTRGPRPITPFTHHFPENFNNPRYLKQHFLYFETIHFQFQMH